MNLSLTFGKRSFSLSTTKAMPPTRAPAIQAREPAPVPRGTDKRMYAAAQTNRLNQDWQITLTSANAEILTSAIAMRSRMRQMERDDDYFRGLLWLLENNVVGWAGIRLRMKCRDASGELQKDLNAAVETAWHDYLSQDNCTVMRNLSGVQVQRMAIRAVARDGPILFRKYAGFNNDYGFAIEPIECDRLDHWWNRPAIGSANEIQFGIEMDKFKAPVIYWILTRHPGDVFAYSVSPKYREPVPASEIIFLGSPLDRAEQRMSMPLWPSIAKRLHNLWGYEESEQVAARAAAAKGGWFVENPAVGSPDEYVGPQDEQGNMLVNTEPGQWEKLPLGWEPKANDPNHPTDAFPHFVKSQLRGAAAGSGIPYNSLAQDLESINYSSYKAGMNDARDGFKYLQLFQAEKMMRPWFRAWLPYAILKGKIPGATPADIERIRLCDRWKPRRWAGLEPLKEVQASVLAIEAGLDSQRNVIEEDFDREIEDVFDDQVHDKKLAKQLGLDFSPAAAVKPTLGSGQVGEAGTEGAESGAAVSGKPSGQGGRNGNGHSLRSMLLMEP